MVRQMPPLHWCIPSRVMQLRLSLQSEDTPAKDLKDLAKTSELTCDIILAIDHPGHIVTKSVAAQELAFKPLTLSISFAVPGEDQGDCGKKRPKQWGGVRIF